jgi:hypothetical protein
VKLGPFGRVSERDGLGWSTSSTPTDIGNSMEFPMPQTKKLLAADAPVLRRVRGQPAERGHRADL